MLKNYANIRINFYGLNWAYHIKIVLESLGFYEIWMHQDIGSIVYMRIKHTLMINTFKAGMQMLIIPKD